jgi:hypothetical protein
MPEALWNILVYPKHTFTDYQCLYTRLVGEQQHTGSRQYFAQLRARSDLNWS